MTKVTQRRQSPIDIRSDEVCHDPDTCQVESMEVKYTKGDCNVVKCSKTGWMVEVKDDCSSTFTGSHLPAVFRLAQFHAHWSHDGSCGSEHLLDGKAMSGEVHFVFWNTTYKTFEEAAEAADGLAVLGVFIQEGEHNNDYQPLFDSILSAIECKTSSAAMPADFSLEKLLPKHDRDFVTYLGSLTTPPYSESVIWTVLTEPVKVGKDQLDVFRRIIAANFRECQDLCERTVRASRSIKV